LENYIGTVGWLCRYIRGRCWLCVVLSKVEKHASYWELIGTIECVTL